mmetsp:Transcript_21929/g.33170  ORF Transcript_21929/g.33170 Transcript_21929/m.33170 type:complete len:130 (-) Transcript_21929:296-685(-)
MPTCPRCGAEKEDRDHIIHCPSSDNWFQTMITTITTWMYKQRTDPMLLTIMTTGIKSWRKNESVDPTKYPTKYQNLITEHNSIGRKQIFNGRWSKQWGQIQQEHYRANQDKKKTGSGWAKKLLLIIWEC